MTPLSAAGSVLRGNSPEAAIGRFRRWKADRHNPLISECVRECRASEYDPLPPVRAYLDPGFRIICKGSVDLTHIRDKVWAIPLSTEPLQAQECMASQADQSRRIVIHNRIGHGDCNDGIVPPKSSKSQQLSVIQYQPAP